MLMLMNALSSANAADVVGPIDLSGQDNDQLKLWQDHVWSG